MNVISQKYSHSTKVLAQKVAKEIHQSLDAQVVQELGEAFARDTNVSGEAKNLAGYLSKWRSRSAMTATALTIGGFISLGMTASTRNIYYRMFTAHAAIACWYGARCQSRTANEAEPILGTLARIQAAQSAISLTQLWEKQPKVSQPVAVETIDTLPIDEPLPLFDWDKLRDCDQYPHFLICGGTGSGKTFSTERIVKFLGGDIEVITTKRKSFQWQGLKVTGEGRDFAVIEVALNNVLAEMNKRMKDLDNNWQPKIIVLDEFPAITANIESATDIITTLIREAREAKIRLFILSQGRQVKTLKLEGQSDLRENLTDILLGQFATDRAKELSKKDTELVGWCRSQQRPILVTDEPAMLP